MNYSRNSLFKLLIDLSILFLAVPIAFFLRFDGELPQNYFVGKEAILMLSFAALAKLASSVIFQPFLGTWRKVSYYDARRIILTAALSSLLWTFSVYLFFEGRLPRSIPILDFGLSLAGLFSIRLFRRYLHEYTLSFGKSLKNKSSRVLLIGAGEAASQLLREIKRHPEYAIRPIALLDDDISKHGSRLHDIPIKGSIDEIAYWIGKLDIQEVIVAVANGNRDVHRRAVHLTSDVQKSLRFRTIPALVDLISGDLNIDRIREVDVEDLLGREPVQLDTNSVRKLIQSKTILITGAGGSIGGELCRQVAKHLPQKIILFGRGENSLYLIEKELQEKFPEIELSVALCNIQNKVRVDSVFNTHSPDVVLHAAAHKHVPIIEDNPTEAVFNNILGTRNLVEVAQQYKVCNFVNISTDKAVNPTSIMGASKNIAESIVFEASKGDSLDCFYVSVRFGNVLGSRGSVIPLFKKQIKAGGPVTVTHPDMIRYFMTIPEAAQLVLQAAALGEQGKLYVLDMGEPVKIYDLAENLIRLSGFELDKDIKIEFTGIRAGEKLYEELSSSGEGRIRTEHSKIFEVSKLPNENLSHQLLQLEQAARNSSEEGVRELLNKFVDGARISITNEKARDFSS